MKATIKGSLSYLIYFVVWQFLAPMGKLVPSLQQMVESFVAVYMILIVVGELTSGTIFQHLFNGIKSLFVIAYLILSLNSGIFGMTFEDVRLVIDLRLLLVIAVALSSLGLAKSVLQAIDYLNEKSEARGH
jgi:hypothetical protein